MLALRKGVVSDQVQAAYNVTLGYGPTALGPQFPEYKEFVAIWQALHIVTQAKILKWMRMINAILRTIIINPKKMTRTVKTLNSSAWFKYWLTAWNSPRTNWNQQCILSRRPLAARLTLERP